MNRVPLFVPKAWDDFLAAVEFYEQRREGLGLEFADDVEAAVERACTFPHRCGKVAGIKPPRDVRRVLIRRFPYLLVFMVLPDKIRVVAVAHSRQRPGYWRTRLSRP